MSCKNIFHFLFVLIMTCPVTGQVKKQLTEDDYKLWSTMELKQLSEKGSWVSYSLQYENGSDTLFVKNTKTSKTLAFAGGTNGQFATDDFFVVRIPNGDVLLTNLKNGMERRYSKISNYGIALNGKLLIMLESCEDRTGNLKVVDLDGAEIIILPEVSLYSLNPENTQLICDSERRLHLLDLKKILSVSVDSTKRSYISFTWQGNGSSFAWIANDTLARVGQYQIKEKKLYTFNCHNFDNFPIKSESNSISFGGVTISDDGKRLFLSIKMGNPVVEPKRVEVWNTTDKMLYDHRAAFQDWKTISKLAVWFPEEQKTGMITNREFPFYLLIPGQEYALVYNPLENEPQFDSDALVNYYLKNISSGQQELLLANHSSDMDKIGISNTGKYIAYFKEKQWWVYDVSSGVHHDLTSRTGKRFTEEKYDRSGEEKVSGIAGWTDNDDELIVYDTYDLWLLKPDGSRALRLTTGREQRIVYRVVSKSPYGATGSTANGVLHVNDGFLLQAVGHEKSGYFRWSAKNGLRKIVFENNRIGWLKYTGNGAYCYIREHYHLSPQLVFQSGNNNKPKVLYQSNPQQNKYNWGFSKLINYENSKGEPLNAALFYPAGYEADKSYPMVVHIYERLSDLYNQYVNPTLFNTDGFNISNFTTQGYFVLLPDIIYEHGETGSSALDCVVSAVDEVLENESVDSKRLGLFGHSFGGYETNFIVTRTNKFAAAISGAGISDIVSSYLSVGRGNKKADGWRYEFNQFRMGTSLFDGYQKYIKNSPITFTGQVTTPLLLWCGRGDTSIPYTQSLEFHLALRRLQKTNIFLLYENGGHAIMQKEDQTDLTHRTQEWFDFYLDGGIQPNWFTPDRL
ncbi:alpha/beta hydrolase family protein [Flavobacterium sp. XGLA_31]|uniref:alpha/beta hydrolase family protein n=1 Tax=Flavobacterium sp. XGLA_31 TaxID=3447666 RepID=UPI003F2E518E